MENMKALGHSEKDILEIFDRRGRKPDFEYLNKGVFKPFPLPEGLLLEYKRNAEESGYNDPMTRDVYKEILSIQKELNGIPLEGDYPEAAKPAAPTFDPMRMSQAPLPPTPGIDAQQFAQTNQIDPQTGLTHTENALLSNEEKAIKLRQQGQA